MVYTKLLRMKTIKIYFWLISSLFDFSGITIETKTCIHQVFCKSPLPKFLFLSNQFEFAGFFSASLFPCRTL